MTNYAVIVHYDDVTNPMELLEVCNTKEQALNFILNEYYKGDKEQMEYEYQGNDFWEENCKGVRILGKK